MSPQLSLTPSNSLCQNNFVTNLHTLGHLSNLATSYRRGSVRHSGDLAYAKQCLVCQAPGGESCSHKLALVRTQLIQALASAHPGQALGGYLSEESNLQRALSRAPSYTRALTDVHFGRLADVRLHALNTNLPPAMSTCPQELHAPGVVCEHVHESLQTQLLDALFPPHYDLINRATYTLDTLAWQQLLAEAALPCVDVLVTTDTQTRDFSVILDSTTVLITESGKSAFSPRLWRCQSCQSTVVQSAQESCRICGAPHDIALAPLPEVEDRLYVNVQPSDVDVASDSVLWQERPVYVIAATSQHFQTKVAAVAAAARYARSVSTASR